MVFRCMHEWDDVELCSGVLCNRSTIQLLMSGWRLLGGLALVGLGTPEVLLASQHP